MTDLTTVQPHTFTLGEAAKAAGVSKPTLSKAVKEGRLSAEKMPDGSYKIQAAELFRAYPPANRQANPNVDARETPLGISANPLHEHELTRLRELLAKEQEERGRERQQLTGQIDDLQGRLDRADEERRKLTAILTDQRAKPAEPEPEPKRGLFGWLGRRG